MKNLRFEKLELLSTIEKRAKTVEFHPRLTVINGENDVGKSSVIKSLYWAFGASAKTHPSWKRAKVKALVTFTVDGIRHFIVRDGPRIALFDKDSKVILSTTSITSELGPAFAQLVNFQLILTDKNGSSGTPPRPSPCCRSTSTKTTAGARRSNLSTTSSSTPASAEASLNSIPVSVPTSSTN